LKGKYFGDKAGEVEHGIGQFMWNDGYAYEGNWELGKMEGRGLYGFVAQVRPSVFDQHDYAKIIQTYKGKFKGGRFNGEGVLS